MLFTKVNPVPYIGLCLGYLFNSVPSAVVVFLFLAGLWFTGAIINGPNFHPKFNLAAPTIATGVYNVASHVDWPSRTLVTVRPPRQDVVLLRRMTTPALPKGLQ